MIFKIDERRLAISLRKTGHTYKEILSQVPVARSTLSLWLRDVGLSKNQTQRITKLKQMSQRRGAEKRRAQRVEASRVIFEMSRNDIKKFSKRDLFILGVALYWAEGTKQKEHRTSVPVEFANSDPEIIRLYTKWIRTFLHISNEDIQLILHIHEDKLRQEKVFKRFWSKVVQLPSSSFAQSVIKKHKPKTKRKNINSNYKGLLVIRVKRSTSLNRRIQGWIYGIIDAQ